MACGYHVLLFENILLGVMNVNLVILVKRCIIKSPLNCFYIIGLDHRKIGNGHYAKATHVETGTSGRLFRRDVYDCTSIRETNSVVRSSALLECTIVAEDHILQGLQRLLGPL